MINLLVTTGITIVISLGALFAGYNYFPLSFIEKFGPDKEDKFGVTITTIAGTDTIKSSRTTINDNFSNLNNGKIENATTSLSSVTTMAGLTSAASLATIGTITSGTWNASTLTVAYGGTGSTTISQYRVVLGDGSSGFTVATTTGIAGQYFISNGVGANPSWQTKNLDTTLNNIWTGLQTFNNFSINIASSTKINGLTYSWPSSTVRASSTLTVDSDNKLSWQYPSKLISSFTTFPSFNQSATNTIIATNIPANVLELANSIVVTFWMSNLTISTGDYMQIEFSYGGATSTTRTFMAPATGAQGGKVQFTIANKNSASSQQLFTLVDVGNRATSTYAFNSITSAINSANVQALVVDVGVQGSGNAFTVDHATVELLGMLGNQ